MLTEAQCQLLTELQHEVRAHGLQSGEIILELAAVTASRYATEPLLAAFFAQQAIRVSPTRS